MSIPYFHRPTSNFISFVPVLPLNLIVMAHIPLLHHQHVHRSCTTNNDSITLYYHTIPEPQSQIVPLLSSNDEGLKRTLFTFHGVRASSHLKMLHISRH